MEQQEGGWRTVGDKHVCAACFSEADIADFVGSKTVVGYCSYCRKRSRKPIGAPMDEVLAFMAEGFSREYDSPANCMSWDDEEGKWAGRATLDGYDLIDEIDVVNWQHRGADELRKDLISAFCEQEYVRHDPYGLSVSEGLQYSWGQFCHTVKHETRFVLFKMRKRRTPRYDRDELIPVDVILARIGKLVAEHGLVKDLPRRKELIRARQHQPSEKLTTVAALGSAPSKWASQSRMSAAGISMFYGAADEKTAFLETFDAHNRRAKIMTFGRFLTARTLWILDLSSLPLVPGIFNGSSSTDRQGIIFLRALTSDISKPISRDGHEHYEYVPTQIFAEYFKRVLKVNRRSIDGIAFRSSRPGATISYCIFTGPEGCADDFRAKEAAKFSFSKKKRVLVLDQVQRRTVADCVRLYAEPATPPAADLAALKAHLAP